MAKAIKVENLSKAYQIGEFTTGTLSKDFERWWALARGKEDPFLKIGETNVRSSKGESNVVWSLRDLNFEVEQGEAIGIIGKNGAGKSTLLKILSQVTTPTSGSVKMKGRVASLLEVGTGFHPELTGRENIYLNGAILGMQKSEVKRKFDEIVDFSGIERYIDTPVKRYSSGMYVRLAFAVAAHLESEILIVDEVLAVGDAEFQKKCISKMGDISKGEGRTILFVSHVLSMIKNLCPNSILMQDGGIKEIGVTSEVLENYNSISEYSLDGVIPDDYPRLYTLGNTRFEFITLYNEKGSKANTFYFREQIQVQITFKVINEILDVVLFLLVKSRDGSEVIYKETCKNRFDGVNLSPGGYTISGGLNVNLMPGNYNITLSCARTRDGLTYEMVENVYDFTVVKESEPNSNSDYKWNKKFGIVLDNDVLKLSKLDK